MTSQVKSNRRLAHNTIILYFRMFLIMGITLYTSRVILQILGVEDYGIYNIVGGIVTIFTSISSSIGNASSRFITFSLGSNNSEEQQNVFSTTIIIHVLFCFIVLLFCETIGLYLFYEKLVIPSERMHAAFWAYQFSIASILFLFMSLPYNSMIIAHEKIKTFAYISILDVILRLAMVYVLPLLPWDKLALYAFLQVLVQTVIQFFYYLYCKYNYPETSFKWVWNKNLQKRILSYSSWIFIGTITSSLYTQGINILLNIFYGPIINAAQGIAMQIQSAIDRLSQNVQTAIRPQITKSYAEKDYFRLYDLIKLGTKVSFILMFMMAVPLIFQIDVILKIWLGNYPQQTEQFAIILILIIIVKLFGSPLMIAIQATEKIRKVELWSCIVLITIPISYWILKNYKIEAYFIFIIALIVEIVSLSIRIHITFKQMKMDFRKYKKDLIYPILKSSVISIIVPFIISYNLNISNLYIKLIFMTTICIISIGLSFYLFGLDTIEKNKIKIIMNNFKKRIIHH